MGVSIGAGASASSSRLSLVTAYAPAPCSIHQQPLIVLAPPRKHQVRVDSVTPRHCGDRGPAHPSLRDDLALLLDRTVVPRHDPASERVQRDRPLSYNSVHVHLCSTRTRPLLPATSATMVPERQRLMPEARSGRSGRLQAIDLLDDYLGTRGAAWTIEGLLPDPRLDPIRDNPRFVALVEKHRPLSAESVRSRSVNPPRLPMERTRGGEA